MSGGAKGVARVAVLVALALVLSYVERLIPLPAPVPGIKLGLANVAVLVALYRLDWREAAAVSGLRVLLGGALFGSGFSVVYALCGAAGSFAAMAGGKRAGLHAVTVSALGGVAHNLAQLTVAAAVVRTPEVLAYAPVLCAAGLATGVMMGVAGDGVIRRVR